MTEQLDFGFGGRRKRKGIAYKQTSREALHSVAAVSGKLDRDILRMIRAAGPAGIICEDIERAIGRTHQAVSGNLRHLVERGEVKWNGKRGKTSRNRAAMLWVITEKDEA